MNTDVKSRDFTACFSAMKMETNIPSPVDGRIISIKAGVGQSLTKDDLILEIKN